MLLNIGIKITTYLLCVYLCGINFKIIVMKKILFLLAMLLLCSCSKSLEDIAKDRAKILINQEYYNKTEEDREFIEKIDLVNPNIVYSTDTMCIINYTIIYKIYGKSEEYIKTQYIIYKDFLKSKSEGNDVFYELHTDEFDVIEKYRENQKAAKVIKDKGFPKQLDNLYEDLFNNTLLEYILSYKYIAEKFMRVP